MKVELRQATLDEIYQLRFAVLRPGQAPRRVHFPGDDAETTRHYGAFVDGMNVGCLTLIASLFEEKAAWQLRGMATHRDYQRQGFGSRLLATLEIGLAPRPAVLWCNARIEAVGFYQRQGWQIVSGQFEIAGVGPHVKMRKDLV
jgi:GNAT superfamily N-acetyltransferase